MASAYDALLEAPKASSEYDALLTQEPAKSSSLRESLGKVLGKAQDIGKEAFSDILPPEIMQTLFGGTASGQRESEKVPSLVSPAAAKEFVGDLPAWAGGQTEFVQGATAKLSDAVSGLFKPATLASLPAFAVPGVAETYAANVATEVPKQVETLTDTIKKTGIFSKETGGALAEAGIQDLMGILAGKSGTAARYRAVEKQIGPGAAPAKPAIEQAPKGQEPTAPVDDLGLQMAFPDKGYQSTWRSIADKVSRIASGLKIRVGFKGFQMSPDGETLSIGSGLEKLDKEYSNPDQALHAIVTEEVAHSEAQKTLGESSRPLYERLWSSIGDSARKLVESAYFREKGSFSSDELRYRATQKAIHGLEPSGSSESGAAHQGGAELFRMLVQKALGQDVSEAVPRKDGAHAGPNFHSALDEIWNNLSDEDRSAVQKVADQTKGRLTETATPKEVTLSAEEIKKDEAQKGQEADAGVVTPEPAAPSVQPAAAPALLPQGREPGEISMAEFRGAPAKIAGPALVDAGGAVIEQGKLGETHEDLLNRALEGPNAEKALEAFTNDEQHAFVDEAGNVHDRNKAAEVGVANGQLPEGTTAAQSQMFKAEEVPVLPGEVKIQWMRNADAGQKFGNQERILPIDEKVFKEWVQPSLFPDAPTFFQYQIMHPENTHVQLYNGGKTFGIGSEWKVGGVGQQSELLPQKGLNAQWAKIVDSHNSPEAIDWGKTSDSKPSAVPVSAPKSANSFQLPYAPLGVPDIVDILSENGGIKSRKGASPENADLWDDQPDLRGVYRQVLGGKLAPDEMAAIAAEHGFGDGSVTSMWKELDKAVKSRRSNRAQSITQQKLETTSLAKDKAFDKAALNPKESKKEINTSNMQVGDEITVNDATFKVTDIDPDTLDVTLEDGKKYGVQQVKDGQAIYVDSADMVPREQDTFGPSTEIPTLRAGETQGDLLSKQQEDLTLVGEKGTDFAKRADEKAAAHTAAEEAKATQDKQQGKFDLRTEAMRNAALAEPGGAPSQRAGIKAPTSEFIKQDVARVVNDGLQGFVKGFKQVRNILAPASAGPEAKLTANIIRENAAELARKHEVAAADLNKAAKAFKKTDNQFNLDVIDKIETGTAQATPELETFSKEIRRQLDARVEQVRAINPNALQNIIEDYFPHIWTPESVAKFKEDPNPATTNPWSAIFGKRPLEGPKSFLKERSIPTTMEGVALGLEPVSWNPVELQLLKLHEMDRYVMGQTIMAEMKDQDLAKFVRAGEIAEPGYVQINDKIARVLAPRDWKITNAKGKEVPGQKLLGHYYAPEDAARIINNYLSPGLRGNVAYDSFRWLGNIQNQVQLGISLYHATFTSLDAATSAFSLGIEQLARSGGSPREIGTATLNIAKGLGEAATGVGGLIENLWRGNKFLREYSRPGTTNADLAKIVDAAVAGGARIKMDTFYDTGSVKSFFAAIKAENYAGAVLRAPFAAIEAASKPLMEYGVPRMKAGVISQMLEYELSKLPKNATRNDIRTVAGRVVDSVDNRMGQMIYDNLFWNRVLKDGLMSSVRSVGWNVGDIREIGGGLLDAVTAPARAYREIKGKTEISDNPVVTHRMAYVVGLPLIVGALGSMYQYLMTGKGPQSIQDAFMPQTGRKKPDGTDERVMLPTYMKDIAPLALAGQRGFIPLVSRGVGMAQNKLHPTLTMLSQMFHNQDYYGNQIRNADDSLVQTVKKEALFAIKQWKPFSVQGVMQREGGVKEKLQAVAGIMPAPGELTRSPAMQLIHEINLGKRPAGGYTEQQQQRRADKHAASQGGDLRLTLFKRLSEDERQRVLDVATPEEKGIFGEVPAIKHRNTFTIVR